jgi:hypothetical protein
MYEAASSLDANENLTPAALADTIDGPPLKIASATAPKTDAFVTNLGYSSESVLSFTANLSSANPLVNAAVSPPIDYVFDITINRDSNTYTIEGDHDGFPAYEIYINGVRVYEHDPLESGDTPISLGPPMEKPMSVTGDL